MKISKRIALLTAIMVVGLGMLLAGNSADTIAADDVIKGWWTDYDGKRYFCPPDCGRRPTPGPIHTGPTPEERERAWEQQDLQEAALDANDSGVEYYEKGDYVNAIEYFREALEYTPDDPDIQNNLSQAENKYRETMRKKEVARRKTLQEASNKAMKEAASAAAHGQAARTSKSPLEAKKESKKVFDIEGVKVAVRGVFKSLSKIFNRGGGREIPPALAKHPEIKKLQKEKKTLVKQRGNLEKKLAAIRQKKAEGAGDKGELEVQEAKTKQEISNADHKIGFVDVKLESYVINFTKEAASSKKP